MARLGETTAMLAKLAKSRPILGAARDAEGFAEAKFSPNPGGLRMLTYAPEHLAKGRPLVVVLHGCAQTGSAFATQAGWTALADQCGFSLLVPEQTSANNHNRCFNWFEPKDAGRDRGEAASIRAMIAEALKTFGADPAQVFITGLSAGGAMAAVMLACYPELFAGGAIIAGLPFGVADSLPTALSAMYGGLTHSAPELGRRVLAAAPSAAKLPRISIWHGDGDATVSLANADQSTRQWVAAHGLNQTPDRVETQGPRTRSQWISPHDGTVLVETNVIHGLGHGAPLATGGEVGLGEVAPFMLEAGISSSLEAAAFWGIAAGFQGSSRASRGRTRTAEAASTAGTSAPRSAASFAEQRRVNDMQAAGDQVMAAIKRRVPPDVEKVIARALKAAGLK